MEVCGDGGVDLEKELLRLSGNNSLEQALASIGISLASTPTAGASFCATKWRRGGAETFIATFSITESKRQRTFVIKACTPPPAGIPIDQVLASWSERRLLIQQAGIQVPTLYYLGEGVLIEEFIPYSLGEFLIQSDLSVPAYQLGRLAGTLAALKFSPTDFLSDLRTRGTDVVMIDFGADLGGRTSVSITSDEYTNRIVRQLSDWGVSLAQQYVQEIRRGFFDAQFPATSPHN